VQAYGLQTAGIDVEATGGEQNRTSFVVDLLAEAEDL